MRGKDSLLAVSMTICEGDESPFYVGISLSGSFVSCCLFALFVGGTWSRSLQVGFLLGLRHGLEARGSYCVRSSKIIMLD